MNIKSRLDNLERTRNRKISVREMSDEELIAIVCGDGPIRELSNEELLDIVWGEYKENLEP